MECFYIFLFFLFWILFSIGMINYIRLIPQDKNQDMIHKKTVIFYFIIIIILFTLTKKTLEPRQLFATSTSQQTTLSEHQHNTEIKKALPQITESRNDFIVKIRSKPQEVDWSGEELLSKILHLLDNPQTDLDQLFNGKIVCFKSEKFYAGSYCLQDNLYCDLLWISISNDHVSLGIEFSGTNQDVKNIENVLESKINSFILKESSQDHYKKAYYDKIYNHMPYDIELNHDMHNKQSTLQINIHPHPVS